jgi:NitT/TauT family transport system ATP-binding protein
MTQAPLLKMARRVRQVREAAGRARDPSPGTGRVAGVSPTGGARRLALFPLRRLRRHLPLWVEDHPRRRIFGEPTGRDKVEQALTGTGSGDLAIAMANVSLTFQTADGPVYALSDVDLTIRKGEFVSFIGPSGCGKTTLLRIVADLEQATGGTVAVNGLPPEQARLQRQYGYVFQAPALYPWRTIERNVMLPLEVFGLSAEERRARAQKFLALVNLTGFERKFPWQLSGGMQQRASICRALIHEPKMLLLDEPFGALDAFTREELWCALRDLHAAQKFNVILVTHDLRESVFLADRVYCMSKSPGRFIVQREIDLPRPRDLEVTYSPEFTAIVQELRGHIGAIRKTGAALPQ